MITAKVHTRKELLTILGQHTRRIQSLGVKRLGVFGSFARDEAKESSDIDFLVEFKEEARNFDNFMDLAFLLEEITGRRVELLTPQSLSKHIGPYILKEVEYVSFAA